jgi:hypothetical protein
MHLLVKNDKSPVPTVDDSARSDLPWRDIINACAMLQRSPSKAPHSASQPKLGSIILRGPGLIDITREATLKNKDRIWAFRVRINCSLELFAKVKQC